MNQRRRHSIVLAGGRRMDAVPEIRHVSRFSEGRRHRSRPLARESGRPRRHGHWSVGVREPAAAAIPPERTVYTSVRIHLSRFIVPLCLVAGAGAFAGTVHAQAKPPETVVLTGSPMGGVKFNH